MDLELVREEDSEVTPVASPEDIAILQRMTRPEKYGLKSSLSRWLDRILWRRDYLSTVSKDTVLEGAFAPRERREFLALQRTCEESHGLLLERANAHSERLGRGYRGFVQAEVIRETVTR